MRPTVVKVGGGLLGAPGALERVSGAVAALGRREPLVVVPGGGGVYPASHVHTGPSPVPRSGASAKNRTTV